MPVVYQTISKNKFRTKKIYAFGRCSNLYRQDKYAKILILSVQVTVCPLYDLANNSLKQFRYWHQDYTIDERTILYFGMHSAKQTMRVKSEIWVQKVCTDKFRWYPYHLISYSLIFVDLVLTCQEGIGNLTFGNWYTSYKLISMRTAMNIPTICTVHGDHIDSAPITSKSQMARIPHGNYCYAYNDSVGLYYIC